MNMLRYHSGGMLFDYIRMQENEIKIVKWYEPSEYVMIPKFIETGETIVAVGPKAFANLPKLNKVIVPDSVRCISEQAFYCLDVSEYIYGDLYDLGWSGTQSLQRTCAISLPPNIQIESPNAFHRITVYTDRRHRRDHYENNLVIRVPADSESASYFLENGWRMYKNNNSYVFLVMNESLSFYDSWYGTMRMSNRLFSTFDIEM